ncbi:hypothetical protein [Amnibacterium soli]|uniref:hypothetical protein n=1 Tax=Amnibacterium soli TaxID=1282736 RepID=UPI0031E9AD22
MLDGSLLRLLIADRLGRSGVRRLRCIANVLPLVRLEADERLGARPRTIIGRRSRSRSRSSGFWRDVLHDRTVADFVRTLGRQLKASLLRTRALGVIPHDALEVVLRRFSVGSVGLHLLLRFVGAAHGCGRDLRAPLRRRRLLGLRRDSRHRWLGGKVRHRRDVVQRLVARRRVGRWEPSVPAVLLGCRVRLSTGFGPALRLQHRGAVLRRRRILRQVGLRDFAVPGRHGVVDQLVPVRDRRSVELVERRLLHQPVRPVCRKRRHGSGRLLLEVVHHDRWQRLEVIESRVVDRRLEVVQALTVGRGAIERWRLSRRGGSAGCFGARYLTGRDRLVADRVLVGEDGRGRLARLLRTGVLGERRRAGRGNRRPGGEHLLHGGRVDVLVRVASERTMAARGAADERVLHPATEAANRDRPGQQQVRGLLVVDGLVVLPGHGRIAPIRRTGQTPRLPRRGPPRPLAPPQRPVTPVG